MGSNEYYGRGVSQYAPTNKWLNMTTKGIFSEAKERHKRLDSSLLEIILTVLFFYFLWLNSFILSIISFVSLFVLPYIFPRPTKKIKLIEDFTEWEFAWLKFPPYSKLFDWFIEFVGFILAGYGTWQHNWLLILIGVVIMVAGVVDFLVRFGCRRAFQK